MEVRASAVARGCGMLSFEAVGGIALKKLIANREPCRKWMMRPRIAFSSKSSKDTQGSVPCVCARVFVLRPQPCHPRQVVRTRGATQPRCDRTFSSAPQPCTANRCTCSRPTLAKSAKRGWTPSTGWHRQSPSVCENNYRPLYTGERGLWQYHTSACCNGSQRACAKTLRPPG